MTSHKHSTEEMSPLPAGVSFHSIGYGRLSELIDAFDWRKTSIGPRPSWPETLKGYVSLIQSLPTAAIIFWNDDQVQIYNDAYSVIMGPRHPKYLGATYRECWPDTYPIIRPWMERVLRDGEVLQVDRTLIPLTRYGFEEEAFFSFTMSPLRDDQGEIRGLLQIVNEMTEAVLADRRLNTLRALAPGSNLQPFQAISKNPNDIPFAALFLNDDSSAGITLSGSTGIDENQSLQWLEWAKKTFALNTTSDVAEDGKKALVIPLNLHDGETPRGVIVFGISSKLRFDENYRAFLVDAARELSANLRAEHQRNLDRWLNLALDSAKMGTWQIDLMTNRVSFSPRVSSFLGLQTPYEKDISQLTSERAHPADLERVKRVWREAVESKSDYSCEYRIIRPSGEVRWLQSWGKAIYDASGVTRAFSGVLLDITDSKQYLIELAESESRFRLMADALPQIIWMADSKTGGVTYASRQWYDYTGLSVEQSLGDAWSSAVHPDDLAGTIEKWSLSLKQGTPTEIEYRLLGKDGVYRHHLTKGLPVRDPEGRVLRWLGTITNIHDQKLAEAAIRAQAEKNARLLESNPTPFLSMNSEWVVNYINPAAQRVLQIPWEKIVGRRLWDMFPGLDDSGFGPTFRQAMKERVNVPAEGYYPDFDKWYQTWAYPLEDGIGVSFLEITEIKKNEIELAGAVRARDEFLSIASHELKTPLTSLKLQIQSTKRLMLKSGNEALTAEKMAKLTEIAGRQTDRLVRLVDDMLDISRITTGKLSFVFETTDIQELLSETVEQLRPQFEAVGSSLHLDCAKSIVTIADRNRIEQVVMNLLTNALKYGNQKPVHVTARENDGKILVSVVDQGIGIAPENQSRVFERFERAISAYSVSGLGLGLFISKQIAEGHGGRIWMESSLGMGSALHFEIPIKKG